jgi:hypothetical protein
MTKKDTRSQPTQTTKDGIQIPIPKRSDFFSNLKKAATPKKSGNRGPKK